MTERAEKFRAELRMLLFGVFEDGWWCNNNGSIVGAWKELRDEEDPSEAVARAICEHLGWTWSDVQLLEMTERAYNNREDWQAAEAMGAFAHRIATLLEAAGTPEPTEGE